MCYLINNVVLWSHVCKSKRNTVSFYLPYYRYYRYKPEQELPHTDMLCRLYSNKKTNEVIFIAHVFLLVYFFLLVTSHCRCCKYKILFPELPLGGCLNLPPQIPTLIFLNTWYFIMFDWLLVEVHCTWLADCLVTCVLYWLHTASRYIVEKGYCWKRSKIEGKLSSIIGIYR